MEEENLTKKEKRQLAKEKKRKQRKRDRSRQQIKKLVTFSVIGAILIFLGVKLWGWINTPVVDSSSGAFDVKDSDWIKGDITSNVTLIEYGDFQCPTCATYAPVIKKLLSEIPEGWKVVYREFPLTSIHANAFDAAKAAEAAGKQGKFWEMHDVLYEKQKDWSEDKDPKNKFLEYVRSLGLDEQQYFSDFNSKEVTDRINEDIALGNELKINSTPTLYLNGEKIMPKSYDEFKQLVETEIQNNKVK